MTIDIEDGIHLSDSLEREMQKKASDLFDNIWSKIGSYKQAKSLIAGVTRMTRRALNASASALFLVDEERQALLLKVADGQAEKRSLRFKIDPKAGVTGWVARIGRPLVTNTVAVNPRYSRLANQVYGFPIKSIICAPLIINRKVIGVIEVANKVGRPDFSEKNLQSLIGIATTIALVIENVRLNECLQEYFKSTVNALVSLADAKEAAGHGHSKRVAQYALMGAKSLSLPEKEKHTIEYAAILHDIGKLAIPDSILNKPDNLTDREREIIYQHSEIGHNLIKEIPFLEEASWLVLYHHERYDGTGYPRHIKGSSIPIGARLIAVADAFDNMTTEHAYHPAMDKKSAFIELRRNIRSQFCPIAVSAFYTGFLDAQSPDKP